MLVPTKSLGFRTAGGCCIVSIHDVSAETLPETLEILAFLERERVFPVALLVVPGMRWSKSDVDALRRFQDKGYELAGHGWRHQCPGWGSIRHRIHGLVISRNRAEHLALSATEVWETMLRCHNWFLASGLRPPRLYVPPGWGLGKVSLDSLDRLPFEIYELLTGVYHNPTKRFTHLPLVGYEADTRLRVWALRGLNGLNQCLARCLRRPLRIAIHPHDLNLRLRDDLQAVLTRYRCFTDYRSLHRKPV